MNRLLDRFCLIILTACVSALVAVSVASAVPVPVPVADCYRTCQMVRYGTVCVLGAPTNNGYEFSEDSCAFCDPSDPANCRFHGDSGTDCRVYGPEITSRVVQNFQFCPCRTPGGTVLYKSVEIWDPLMVDTEWAAFPYYHCISI